MDPISFISARGRGMTVDIHFIRTWLLEHSEDLEFRYFLKAENTSNKLTNQSVLDAKKMFCKDLSNCICIDGSITAKHIKGIEDRGEKVLYAIPYDYQFDLYLKGKEGDINKKNTFSSFDHIIAGCPFTEKLLSDWYSWKREDTLLKDISYPLSYEMHQEKTISMCRERIGHFYKAAEGKKVVSLLLQGDRKDLPEDRLLDFDLKRFMDQLPDDWFFLTNSVSIIERASQLPNRYRNSFGYLNRFIPNIYGFLVADALITNNSYYAVQYAAKRKPVFYMDFGAYKFVQFMNQEYSALKFGKEEHYAQLKDTLSITTEDQKRFFTEFAYDQIENPYSTTHELMKMTQK